MCTIVSLSDKIHPQYKEIELRDHDSPTVLGRNHFANLSPEESKKISRNQLQVSFSNNGVSVEQVSSVQILPPNLKLGVNPGSVVESGKRSPLERGTKRVLRNGDMFCILLKDYAFQVKLKDSKFGFLLV